MKKINAKKLFSITTLSIFTLIPAVSIFSHENHVNIINYDKTKLETKPNSSPIITKFAGNFFRNKNYLTNDILNNIYNDYSNQSVPFIKPPLSTDSINAAYNNAFLFNWIKWEDGKIRIVATPTNLDMTFNHNPVVLKTDFDSIEDSAIWKDQCLVLIGTKGDNKYLNTYQFENIFKYENKNSVKLVQKDSIKISKYGSDFPDNIKYGLSPYNQQIKNNNNTNLLLFPVGATANNYENNKNSIFKHVSITEDGKISINNIPINFDIPTLDKFNADDKIISVTVVCTNDNSKPIFYAYSTHENENGIVTGIRFFPQGQSGTQNNQKILDLNYISGRKYVTPDYNRIVPYGMFRNSDSGINDKSFNIYWIIQNQQVDSANRDLKVPEQLIFSKTNYNNLSVEDPSYEHSGFEKGSGSINGNSWMSTITYGIGGELDEKNPSYIALTYIDGYTPPKELRRFNLVTGDLKLSSKDSIPNTYDLNNLLRLSSTYAGKCFINKSTPNVRMTSIVYNGIFECVGYDPYTSSAATVLNPSFNIFYYPANDIKFSSNGNSCVNLLKLKWTNDKIVLPIDKNAAKIYYPEETTADNIFYRTNQMKYWYRGDENITIPRNSSLWYARNFAVNLTKNQYDLTVSGEETNDFLMKLRSNPSFLDKYGNEIIGNGSQTPNDADTVIFDVVQPKPILFGWYSPAGEEINNTFTMYNNPANEKPVIIKNGFHLSFPSINKISIDNFNSSGSYNRLLRTGKSIEEKIIPQNQNTIGFEGSNDLIQLNYTYVNNYFAGIESHADDLNGTLNGKIYYWNNDNSLWSVDFSISGFISIVLIVGIVAAVIGLLLIILLIIVLTKHFKNKKDSNKVRKSIKNTVINKLK